MVNRIAGAIQGLSVAAKEVSLGHIDIEIKIKANDEVRDLVESPKQIIRRQQSWPMQPTAFLRETSPSIFLPALPKMCCKVFTISITRLRKSETQ